MQRRKGMTLSRFLGGILIFITLILAMALGSVWKFLFFVLPVAFGAGLLLEKLAKREVEKKLQQPNLEKALKTIVENYGLDTMLKKKQYKDPNNYEKYLQELAYKAEVQDANMYNKINQMLQEFYQVMEQEDKYAQWLEHSIKTKTVNSIYNHYKFSQADVESDKYDEILKDIEEIPNITDGDKELLDRMKGIVYYKQGKWAEAKKYIKVEDYTTPNAYKLAYMLFRCSLKVDTDNYKDIQRSFDVALSSGYKPEPGDWLDMYRVAYNCKQDKAESYKKSLLESLNQNSVNDRNKKAFMDVAFDMSQGNYDFTLNTWEAACLYAKVADFGDTTAAYLAGKLFLEGKNGHDYTRATLYLQKAAQASHGIAKSLLAQYAVENVIVKIPEVETKTYDFKIGSYTLTVPEENYIYQALIMGMITKSYFIRKETTERYDREINSIDDCKRKYSYIYSEQLNKMLDWCLRVLLSFGIDTYDKGYFQQRCEAFQQQSYPLLQSGLQQIQNTEQRQRMEMDIQKASRTQWQGVGIGTTIGGTIKAQIKSSIAAGIMNAGSSILHSIGDSMSESENNKQIQQMTGELYKNPALKKEFCETVLKGCLQVVSLASKLIINPRPLQGNIIFEGIDLATYTDREITAKLNNMEYAQENDTDMQAKLARMVYASALLLERLKRMPTDSQTIEYILGILQKLAKAAKDSSWYADAIRYARDFTTSY